MVLAGFVGGFGWFWVVPCFSNYQGCYGGIEKKKGLIAANSNGKKNRIHLDFVDRLES